MKSQTAAEVAAALDLARSGWRPASGDLVLIAVVDEEVGGADGAVWITEQHPDLVRCDWLINEGAGAVMISGRERFYGVCVAEKGVHRFRITAHGVAAHASNPHLGDNALVRLAPLVERLGAARPQLDPTPAPLRLLAALGLDPSDPAAALAELRERDAALADLVEPALGVTFAPTVIRASEAINVIPARASVDVDCRTPPGMGDATVLARVAQALGAPEQAGYDVEIIERIEGNGSPVDSPLMDAIARWVAHADPGALAVPVVLPAFTDSHTFRAAFPECVAYGFFPMRHTMLEEMWPLIHAADERIDVRDLAFAAQAYRDIIVDLLGS
jgi:acetylornithine deacetylase/succinyl-diaminopimelate desuccinylase-like protein